jgi:hypothetical protein
MGLEILNILELKEIYEKKAQTPTVCYVLLHDKYFLNINVYLLLINIYLLYLRCNLNVNHHVKKK